MAKINIEFDGKIYSVDEATLLPLASSLERALIQQLAGTGAIIRLGSTNYNVDANKLASARNVLTDNFGNVAGSDNTVTVNGVEYGLSKNKLQSATDQMNETLVGMKSVKTPSEGLEYGFNNYDMSYSVVGIGTCTDTEIVIPSTYEGLPVKRLSVQTYHDEENPEMEYGTFEGCNNVTSITVPDSVTSLCQYAFANCENLTTVVLGNGIAHISDSAFAFSRKLRNVTIPNSVTSICYNAFFECDGLEYYEDNNGKYLGNSDNPYVVLADLADKTVESFEINSATKIIHCAFQSCNNLKSVTIPNGVIRIEYEAFKECNNLTTITIPESVESIGPSMSSYCKNLTNINVSTDSPFFQSIDGNLYSKDGESLIQYAVGKTAASFVIPEGVGRIEEGAFSGCDRLSSITIPSSTWTIQDSAFSGCHRIIEVINKSSIRIGSGYRDGGVDTYAIEVHDGASRIVDKDGYIFYTYEDINYLVNYTGQETELTLPENYMGGNYKINKYAFYDRSEITSVTIPTGVISMGNCAFKNCLGLTTINFDAVDLENLKSRNEVFSYAGHTGEGITVNIGENVSRISEYLFSSMDNRNYSPKIISVNFASNSVCESISRYAFQYCKDLTSIAIPSSVTSIAWSAFSGCDNLKTIYVDKSKDSISSAPWCSDAKVIWDCDGIVREYIFETNGGTHVESLTVACVEKLPTTAKEDYYFMGWYTDSEFSGEPISDYYSSKTHLTLYAKWATEEEWLASGYGDGKSFDRAAPAVEEESYTVSIDESEQYYYFKFIPSETAWYSIYSSGDCDTCCYLYDSERNLISEYDDYDEEDVNFYFDEEFNGGDTYYVAVRLYGEDTGEFTVTFGGPAY